ncbi:ATP-binding cassette domain-containing protein [Marixanthotalea marina]|uniref:ATP-binding cassette domain-containing protein n=1 Tax=Marixanthotalea marina TaxID=2844359 RepID=UPI002989F548|nr:ATP-binding cassette domain-containing protein [Marixanthotalea marina]
MHTHKAIYISNKDDKQQLIEWLMSGELLSDFKNKKGVLFSEITINKFIDEEVRHDHFYIATPNKKNLQTSSEGERKKALLNYLISQNPDYLVVDNVFGNLDTTSQQHIVNELTQLSLKIPIIQITNRKKEVLPFISQVYSWQGDSLVPITDLNNITDAKTNPFVGALPKYVGPDFEAINPLVVFKNVTVRYGERTIVKDINWEIKKGEFWQLVGPNGAGKSTLLSMIFGDNPKAYHQDITLFGMKKGSGESVWDIKKHIGYFSSEMLRGFMRSETIENMILSGFYDSVGLYKYPSETQIAMAKQWLEILGMYHIKNKSFLFLSRGHQRLVLIARAMVKQPPLLILDEPTNGLDDADADLFCQLINKIATETPTAILYVSHRKEDQLLAPDFVYELIPSETGSVGKSIKEN